MISDGDGGIKTLSVRSLKLRGLPWAHTFGDCKPGTKGSVPPE